MSTDVSPDQLTIIQSILKQYVPTCRVVAFGSRVTQTARDTSDLDLCLMSDKRISFATLANLRDAFSQSRLPYKVDVIDWSAITPDFQKLISENYLEIQAAGA